MVCVLFLSLGFDISLYLFFFFIPYEGFSVTKKNIET